MHIMCPLFPMRLGLLHRPRSRPAPTAVACSRDKRLLVLSLRHNERRAAECSFVSRCQPGTTRNGTRYEEEGGGIKVRALFRPKRRHLFPLLRSLSLTVTSQVVGTDTWTSKFDNKATPRKIEPTNALRKINIILVLLSATFSFNPASS